MQAAKAYQVRSVKLSESATNVVLANFATIQMTIMLNSLKPQPQVVNKQLVPTLLQLHAHITNSLTK